LLQKYRTKESTGNTQKGKQGQYVFSAHVHNFATSEFFNQQKSPKIPLFVFDENTKRLKRSSKFFTIRSEVHDRGSKRCSPTLISFIQKLQTTSDKANYGGVLPNQRKPARRGIGFDQSDDLLARSIAVRSNSLFDPRRNP